MIAPREILIQHLRAMSADGLCNPSAECGCGLADLAPCQCLNLDDCLPAKHVKTSLETHALHEEFPDGYYHEKGVISLFKDPDHALHEEFPDGYYLPLLPISPFKSECLWTAYLADPTYENCCKWLKHRAWMRLEGCP